MRQTPFKKMRQEFPLWLSGFRTSLVSMRMQGLSLASLWVKDLALSQAVV